MPFEPERVAASVIHLLSLDPGSKLSEIAHLTGVERHLLEAALRRFTGLCFREHRNLFRLDGGLRLIVGTTLPFKQIAHALGYGSVAAFDHFILARTGRAPSEIRKKRRIFHKYQMFYLDSHTAVGANDSDTSIHPATGGKGNRCREPGDSSAHCDRIGGS